MQSASLHGSITLHRVQFAGFAPHPRQTGLLLEFRKAVHTGPGSRLVDHRSARGGQIRNACDEEQLRIAPDIVEHALAPLPGVHVVCKDLLQGIVVLLGNGDLSGTKGLQLAIKLANLQCRTVLKSAVAPKKQIAIAVSTTSAGQRWPWACVCCNTATKKMRDAHHTGASSRLPSTGPRTAHSAGPSNLHSSSEVSLFEGILAQMTRSACHTKAASKGSPQ